MKKRLLILGMIFTMAVSSAGCGSSSSDNAGKTEQPKQTATVQDTAIVKIIPRINSLF